MQRFAIALGLTHVDPAGYGGWFGDCPGTDVDAAAFAKLCHDKGFSGVNVLVNSFADDRYLEPVFLRICEQLQPDDLLVLFFSGHGGQQPDENGDEEDGRDETICLWSRELVDDDIGQYLQLVPADVRMLMVSDSCHAGTNFRARRNVESQPITLDKSTKDMEASLLHFGGCSDDRFSYGDEDGGEFTQRLVKVARRSRKPLTYRQWFDRTMLLMPTHQTPTITACGEETFENREMLT